MREKVVLIGNDIFYKNNFYDIVSVENEIGEDIEFIILEEKLSIKVFNDIEKVKEEFLKEIVEEEYSQEESILTHYEYDKKNKRLFLYSIGNGDKLISIARSAKSVTVIPIQFYIKKLIDKKKRKLKNYRCLMSIDTTIYYMKVVNNFIVENAIEGKSNLNINDEIFKGNEDLVINTTIMKSISEDIRHIDNITILDIGEVIGEKILQV